MITRSFYFLRHGETDWNVEKRLQGHTNTSLNEKGRSQARAAIDVLRKHKIDRIVSSSLNRAFETAEIVNTVLALPLEREDRLREKSFGIYEGKTTTEIEAWKLTNAHLLGPVEVETGYPAPPEGESYSAAFARTMEGFGHWLTKCADENILFVSHGGVYRILCRHFFGKTDQAKNSWPYHFHKESDTLWLLKELS